MKSEVCIIGCASGLAGVDERTGQAPMVLKASPYFSQLASHFTWNKIIFPHEDSKLSLNKKIQQISIDLAEAVSLVVKQEKFFTVIGGDHACAIGTWSGVYDAIHDKGDLGLIWLDAHMDCHTPETSETGRIHGMPCASLMGYGIKEFINILQEGPKVKPENLVLIGLRSYEKGEAELLKRLNVRTYFMDEVKQRGFETVLAEAVEMIKHNTVHFGVSFDLDCIDPKDAPGVDVPEPDGISAEDMLKGLLALTADPKLIGLEIVEFDPGRDRNHLTEKLLVECLAVISKGYQSRMKT